MRSAKRLGLLSLCLAAGGCISRSLLIETTPSGAEVRINGHHAGRTPLTFPFRHYGEYRIELRKEGRATVDTGESVSAPWYARFPACLLTEFLIPCRIRDTRVMRFTLDEATVPDRASLLERAASRTE